MIHYSGSNSLQLPFALFGLGETPNFIEDLTVGAGYSVGDDMKNGNATLNLGIHQWSLLVPNSQVIVSLFPIDDANKYVILLTITVHSCFFYLISRAYRAAKAVYTPLLICNIPVTKCKPHGVSQKHPHNNITLCSEAIYIYNSASVCNAIVFQIFGMQSI